MALTSADDLLTAYDTQLRARVPDRLPAGESVERDGPLLRYSGGPGGGWVLYRDLAGIEGTALDELIARQVAFFAERGDRFEWKHHGHDLPADLPERLRAAGFVPEDTETIVIARVADIAGEPRLPDGVSLREVTERADFERIAGLEEAVWGEVNDWLPDMLESERAVDPDRSHDRRRRGGRYRRLRSLDPLRGRHGVRDALGRCDARGLASPRDLPRHRRLPRESRRRARFPLPRDRCLGRQQPDPPASRLRPGDDDHAVHLVAASLAAAEPRVLVVELAPHAPLHRIADLARAA